MMARMKELEAENARLRKMYIEEKLKAEIVAEALEKLVRPSRRSEMAKRFVQERGVPIKLACEAFKVSEACYRYISKRKPENEEIANWLLRLTDFQASRFRRKSPEDSYRFAGRQQLSFLHSLDILIAPTP